ncbi:MAG: NAD(P)/FAD-dependent oxidoreductase [Prevotellaceae bacterium]|nr:NAD(P)/FAD-dependent oxidoreductase [Prevotellaceae bacterium]
MKGGTHVPLFLNRDDMMKYDIAIIGSGLGGLECGCLLAKRGFSVCILEKNGVPGGSLQSFGRGGMRFDTGFHCVGGLDEGQSLRPLFETLGLMDLPWRRMDDDGFAEVVLGDRSFFFASGHERFAERLAADFPRRRENLKRFAAVLRETGEGLRRMLDAGVSATGSYGNEAFGVRAFDFLRRTADDPLLFNVLSGASLTMELNAATLPLYVFAQINNSFVQSAWRLDGDGSAIVDRLAENVRRNGGAVLTGAKATRLIETDGRISAVEFNGGERVEARCVISDAHPAATLELIPESRRIRRVYRERLSSLENTFGFFTVHLHLRKNTVRYFNRNIFVYDSEDVWGEHRRSPAGATLVSCRVPCDGGEFTDNIDILTPMHWEEVERWADTTVGRRGDEYREFKRRRAERCVAAAERRIPGLAKCVERMHTSSPLTWRDYTGTRRGSAYGIRKDCDNLLYTMIAPQTPIANLLLTGQNLNLHGILGVSMTSLFTCEKALDALGASKR